MLFFSTNQIQKMRFSTVYRSCTTTFRALSPQKSFTLKTGTSLSVNLKLSCGLYLRNIYLTIDTFHEPQFLLLLELLSVSGTTPPIISNTGNNIQNAITRKIVIRNIPIILKTLSITYTCYISILDLQIIICSDIYLDSTT